MHKRKILVFDTETTGFENEDRIIQIGSVMTSRNRTYSSESWVQATKEISVGSMTAHGIRRLPTFTEKLSKTKTIKRINSLKENDIVVGHNIDFDLNMARGVIHNDKFKVIDTLLIAEFLRQESVIAETDKINLQYLRYLWITEKRENELIKKHKPKGGAHSALFDSLITNEILEVLINTLWEIGYSNPWEKAIEIYENRFSPYSVELTFGKYKGMTVFQVYQIDSSYLEWFHENIDGRDREKKAIVNLSNELKTTGK